MVPLGLLLLPTLISGTNNQFIKGTTTVQHIWHMLTKKCKDRMQYVYHQSKGGFRFSEQGLHEVEVGPPKV